MDAELDLRIPPHLENILVPSMIQQDAAVI